MKRRLLIVCTISFIGLFLLSMTAQRPDNLGVIDGKLSPLPESPNAVSSQAANPERRLPPLKFSGLTSNEVIEKIVNVASQLPRTRIVAQTEDYLHVEFRSLIFRFVDDVEFHVDVDTRVVNFRSASRVGHSDMGVNRRRMQKLISILSLE